MSPRGQWSANSVDPGAGHRFGHLGIDRVPALPTPPGHTHQFDISQKLGRAGPSHRSAIETFLGPGRAEFRICGIGKSALLR